MSVELVVFPNGGRKPIEFWVDGISVEICIVSLVFPGHNSATTLEIARNRYCVPGFGDR